MKHILKDTPFKEGTWSFRLASLFCVSPVYAAVLWAVGTAVGRNAYFAPMSAKIANRFNVLGMARRISKRRQAYEEADLKKVRDVWALGAGRWRGAWRMASGGWGLVDDGHQDAGCRERKLCSATLHSPEVHPPSFPLLSLPSPPT